MARCDEDKAREIIESIINEKLSLDKCIRERGINPNEFFQCIYRVPSLQQDYYRAQQARAELLADEIIDIADTELDANRARVRVDARRWYASKMQPQKYGDRIELNVTETVDIRGALAEAKARTLTAAANSTMIGEIVEPKSKDLVVAVDAVVSPWD